MCRAVLSAALYPAQQAAQPLLRGVGVGALVPEQEFVVAARGEGQIAYGKGGVVLHQMRGYDGEQPALAQDGGDLRETLHGYGHAAAAALLRQRFVHRAGKAAAEKRAEYEILGAKGVDVPIFGQHGMVLAHGADKMLPIQDFMVQTLGRGHAGGNRGIERALRQPLFHLRVLQAEKRGFHIGRKRLDFLDKG